MKQTDIWWTVAAISSLCCMIYGFFLTRKLTTELDYNNFYNCKDQETYVEIIQNPKYQSFIDASAVNDDKLVSRRLSGFEIDQLFEHLGPIQIGGYIQKIKEGEETEH